MKIRLMPVLLMPACLFGQAAGQNAPDLQKILDRLDELEKQNRELLTEIQKLRGELKPSAAPAATPDVAERLDVQEARTAELAQAKVESSQKFPVSLTGMLLFNAFANGKYGGGSEYPFTAALTPSAADTGATFRQTILGLKFNGPDLPGGGKASGTFYMDFWGGTSSAGNNLFRVRTATIDLTWKDTTVSVGQDKPIIAPRDPVSLAQVSFAPLSSAGNLWLWQPQARIEQRFSLSEDAGVRVQAGVYETSESYPANGAPAFANTLEKARPAYQGRVEFFKGPEKRRFEIAPGVSLSTSHVAGTSVASHLATVDWLARPVAAVEFTGAFFHGDDAAGLGALRQGFMVMNDGSVLPVHANGGWAQVAFIATPRLSFHLYGGEESDHSAGFSAGNITRNLTYAGNLMYKLAPNIVAAIEIAQNRTDYVASGSRLSNHYDLALGYLF
jgi:hypothetical protein